MDHTLGMDIPMQSRSIRPEKVSGVSLRLRAYMLSYTHCQVRLREQPCGELPPFHGEKVPHCSGTVRHCELKYGLCVGVEP